MKDLSGQGAGEPAIAAFSISPSDQSYLPYITRAVFIGSAGNLAVMMFNGDIVVFTNVVAGSVLPIRVVKVFSTGTTVISLLGMY